MATAAKTATKKAAPAKPTAPAKKAPARTAKRAPAQKVTPKQIWEARVTAKIGAAQSKATVNGEVGFLAPIKPLNQTQLAYARMRLAAIFDKRLEAALLAIPSIGERPSLTFKDKYALIKSGKAKLQPLESVGSYTQLNDAYTYPEHEKHLDAWDAKKKEADAKAEKVKAALSMQRQAIADELAFGVDGSRAMQLLQEFEAGV